MNLNPKPIIVTKHLNKQTKIPKVIMCYDFYNRIFDGKKNLVFVIEPKLFSIGFFFPLIISLKVRDHEPLNIVEAKPIIHVSNSNPSSKHFTKLEQTQVSKDYIVRFYKGKDQNNVN
jgi:hypothetical protein